MSYTDMRDFNAEYAKLFEGRVVVLVEKSGSGTVGRSYADEVWRYAILTLEGVETTVVDKGRLTVYGAITHKKFAKQIHGFWSDGDM